jgi:hypothetical protein
MIPTQQDSAILGDETARLYAAYRTVRLPGSLKIEKRQQEQRSRHIVNEIRTMRIEYIQIVLVSLNTYSKAETALRVLKEG